MLTFANSWFLLLLPLIPLPVWWWLRRRRPALRVSAVALFASLPPGRSRRARWVGAALRAAVLALILLALAEPRIPDVRTRIATEGIAIMLVVDISGSMAEQDFVSDTGLKRRIDAVKLVLELFVKGGEAPSGVTLDGRPDDLIGLVTFATHPETACPLTLSHSALLKVLNAQEPKSGPDESQTNIGDALAWGLHRLESAGPRRKVLMLVTDGEHNVPAPALTPRQAGQLAASLRVPIYVIDAGNEASNLDKAGGVNPGKILQAVSGMTRGRYFTANDTEGLLAVCREIDRLERQEIQSFLYRRYYELYPWCGLAAFVFLLGVRVLELTVWRQVP